MDRTPEEEEVLGTRSVNEGAGQHDGDAVVVHGTDYHDPQSWERND